MALGSEGSAEILSLKTKAASEARNGEFRDGGTWRNVNVKTTRVSWVRHGFKHQTWAYAQEILADCKREIRNNQLEMDDKIHKGEFKHPIEVLTTKYEDTNDG